MRTVGILGSNQPYKRPHERKEVEDCLPANGREMIVIVIHFVLPPLAKYRVSDTCVSLAVPTLFANEKRDLPRWGGGPLADYVGNLGVSEFW